MARNTTNLCRNRGEAEISSGAVQEYVAHRRSLDSPQGGKISDATIRAEIGHGKQFYNYAKAKGYSSTNPFAVRIRFSKGGKRIRRQLDGQMLQKVIESFENLEWRAYVAVLRWTGCRASEPLYLLWTDIDWAASRIRMPSPKTERTTGESHRIVPLPPELRPILLAWREDPSRKESPYVLPTIVTDNERQFRGAKNLRKPFADHLKKVGIEPWLGPFQNMRVTRENELLRLKLTSATVGKFLGNRPEPTVESKHVYDEIGHSKEVSDQFYAVTTDEDFRKVTDAESDSG